MLLDNLLHDGETQARAANTRRHVRLGQSLAILRQSDTRIDHIDDEFASLFVHLELDPVARQIVLAPAAPRFDRFDRILHDVTKRLAELPTIANHFEIALRRVDAEADAGMRHFMKEYRLPGDFVDVLMPENRLGHPREVGEFVDHAAQVADLPDDCTCQPLKRFRLGLNFLSEAALEPLGRELDRCQRVLDLMSDPAGNVRPGGTPLVAELVGDVVEGDDGAVLIADPFHGQGALPRPS